MKKNNENLGLGKLKRSKIVTLGLSVMSDNKKSLPGNTDVECHVM